jgi:hypothetical protein
MELARARIYDMEIIGEIIIQVAGWILEFLAELLLQMLAEIIVEVIGHGIVEPFRRRGPAHPWLAAIGYLTYDAAAGGLSIWLAPDHFIKSDWLRLLNLALTPIAAGLLMGWIGASRRRRGRELIRLESFAYGFCFALSMAVIRYAFGR